MDSNKFLMGLNKFLTEIDKITSAYGEDANYEISFIREKCADLDEGAKQDCEETDFFEGAEYISQMQTGEDCFEGYILRKIKNTDWCLCITYAI
ncbi:hypothetical protein AG2_017 [Listeria phage vB_LmoM_AG20]|uniref:Uncharacterized protein n=1 Tax=Listeria phage vB_LmoM_AG20 TaxID=1168744 RepID=M4H112_9CAUD|nr:hypothetical protein AG2_017 [Listeria phage vB_LmoM_AG20]AFJ75954.1 hypothetical protein AG2_017 [Listeria phage vB_LmoM_AG20]WIW77247.1 hypothetical protein CKA15_020 [Listeria phage cka15]